MKTADFFASAEFWYILGIVVYYKVKVNNELAIN